MRRNSYLVVRVAALTLTAIASIVPAAPLTITNPSFETPALDDSGIFNPINATFLTTTGWTKEPQNANAGIWNPPGGSFTSVPDGAQVLYVNNNYVHQTLNATVVAKTTYTLEVSVGDRKDGVNIATYKVELWAGANMLAQDDNGLDPANDQWLTSTLIYTALAGSQGIGESLQIRLYSGGPQVCFDHVRLDATPLPPEGTVVLIK